MISVRSDLRHRSIRVAGVALAMAFVSLATLTTTDGAAAADSTAPQQGLMVHRGTDILAEKDRAAGAKIFAQQQRTATGARQETGTGVTVVRGHGFPISAAFEAGVAAIKQPRFDAVGSDGGWFIDHEAGRLIHCFRVRTGAVGGYRIRCSSRPLP